MSTRDELPECKHRGTWSDKHTSYNRICLYPGRKKHYCKGWLINNLCPNGTIWPRLTGTD